MMIPGGHAIMLAVDLPEEMLQATEDWVARDRGYRSVTLDKPHLTVTFVGHNLDHEIGEAMELAADELSHQVDHLILTGRTTMLGFRKDHLVALVEPTDELLTFRGAVLEMLLKHDVRPNMQFANFTPHVSLAMGRRFDEPMKIMKPTILSVKSMIVKLGDERSAVYELVPDEPEMSLAEELAEGSADMGLAE